MRERPLEKELVRAYLAAKVVRLAFSPKSDSEKARWLNLYHRTISRFWEVERDPDPPKRETSGAMIGRIPYGPAAVAFDYTVHRHEKFSLCLLHGSTRAGSGALWTHEADPAHYAFPGDLALRTIGGESRALAADTWGWEDIEAVIDGLVCHPRVHLHIEEPALRHDLRMGVAQDNAFLFLFHVRYQGCVIEANRMRERTRLCKLFAHSIADRELHIPPKRLFQSE